MTDAPTAEVIAVRTYGGVRTARVMCPFCSQTHLHPWPVGDVGLHVGHCGRGDYTIGTV